MMKKLQEDLLRKTQSLERGYRADREDLTEGEKMLLRRLSDEQGKLGELMKRFIDKFEKMRQQQERPPERRKGPSEE